MKWTTMVAGSLLTCFAYCEPVVNASPPLDRPSPPPCCADGVCRPNPTTFGVYPTRWRRWPCEELQPTPATGGDTGLSPDVKPFETPRVEDEDRRAPPPSKQAQEKAAEEREQAGQSTTPPAGSGGAVIPPDTGLPPLPIGPTGPAAPAGPAGGGTEGPATMPWDAPATPGGEGGLPSRPWDKKAEPTSDSDPPPAPPVATATVNSRRAKPVVSRPKKSPQRAPSGPMQISSASDPPPSLPLALSGGSY